MQYDCETNKAIIPTCNILGVNVATVSMKLLLDFTYTYIKELSGSYITAVNVFSSVIAYKDASYCRIQNSAVLAIPDGGPLASIGRHRGYGGMKRTAGPSYMVEIFKISVKKGYRHYFYGSTEETLRKIRRNLSAEYPGIKIAGMYSPPFRPTTADEDAAITERINASGADFVWVGLGAPKQEIWMAQHEGKLNGLMIGVGAGFDYCAGNIKRAPQWMQEHNLEWFYRVMQSPSRLFSRYLYSNIMFIWHAVIMGR